MEQNKLGLIQTLSLVALGVAVLSADSVMLLSLFGALFIAGIIIKVS